jgi:uncharacterized protein
MQYLILHGSFGNSQENWFPWLKLKLEDLGHTVIAPDLPIDKWDELVKHDTKANINQNLENWLTAFKTQVLPKINHSEPISLAAHSSGPLFSLHAIDLFDLSVNTAVFVAPFLNRLPTKEKPIDIVNFSFYLDTNDHQLDFHQIKQKIKTSYVLYADNDPYVPIQFSLDFAQAVNAKPILIERSGHLNATASYTQFPQLLELLIKPN